MAKIGDELLKTKVELRRISLRLQKQLEKCEAEVERIKESGSVKQLAELEKKQHELNELLGRIRFEGLR